MKSKLAGLLLILAFVALALPGDALGQERIIRRDRNGIRAGDHRISVFDGDGIVTYERRNRWMSGPRGAATVIGIGAGAGAVTGGVVKGKKGAVVGALVGAGAATGIWLYKNRRTRTRIF